MSPPLHPLSVLSQSTRFCSDNGTGVPVTCPFEITDLPSIAPVVEKDQQLPHCPWFLTGVTAPFATQSTESQVAAGKCTGFRCSPSFGTKPPPFPRLTKAVNSNG